MNSFCVIGLGKFGQTVATTLAENGKQVMIIDQNADAVTPLADTVTHAVIGDPTNESVIRASGIEDYECAIICISGNINDNILLCIMLRELGVKHIVARAVNEGHRKVLSHIGVDEIVFPEQDMGEKLAFKLSRNNVTEFIEFSGYQLVEMNVPKDWIGKTIINLDIRKKYGINVIAVTNSETEIADVSPSPTRAFTNKDRITIIASDENMDKIMKKYG